MEKICGVSYPTIRARIDEIAALLGAATPAAEQDSRYDGAENDENVFAGDGGSGNDQGGTLEAGDGGSGNALGGALDAGDISGDNITGGVLNAEGSPSRLAILKRLADGEIDVGAARELLKDV
jgi:hypothetical protein